jgi:hypothetical protein
MVHAYLMYGFPTQTAQETIDSLEMVRQMFRCQILKSGFWHQFALTAHSPVGLEPEKYFIKKDSDALGTFANNDLQFTDPKGTRHGLFSDGLKKSLFNYMHGIGIDEPLQKWFEHTTPKPSVETDFIEKALEETVINNHKPTAKIFFLGTTPQIEFVSKSKKGRQWEMASIVFYSNNETIKIELSKEHGIWLGKVLSQLKFSNEHPFTYQDLVNDYEQAGLEDFDLFWYNKPMSMIYKAGLLVI